MGWIILIVIIVIVGMSEYFSDKTGSASSRKKLANGLNRKLIMEKQKDLLVKYGARDISKGVVGRNNDIIFNYMKDLCVGRASHNFNLAKKCFIDIYNIEGYGYILDNPDSWSEKQIKDFEESDKSVFKGLYKVISDTFEKRIQTLNILYLVKSVYLSKGQEFFLDDFLSSTGHYNKPKVYVDGLVKEIKYKDKQMEQLILDLFDKLSDSGGNLYYTINTDKGVLLYSELADIIKSYVVNSDISKNIVGIKNLLEGFFGVKYDIQKDLYDGENIEDIINNIFSKKLEGCMFKIDDSKAVVHDIIDKLFGNNNNLLFMDVNVKLPALQTFYFEEETTAINNIYDIIKEESEELIKCRSVKINEYKNLVNEIILSHNNGVKGIEKLFENGEKLGVESWVRYVIDGLYFDNFSDKEYDLLYDKESKSLIIEYKFPSLEMLPRLKEIKQNGKEVLFSDSAMKKIYDKYILSVCIKILYEIYNADIKNYIDGIVFNGIVTSIDKSNGHERTDCILSVSTEKKDIKDIILENIDPKETIRSLHGVCATSLSTLTPVAPISTIDKNDKRFVEGYNVIDSLDDSVNIACMDWQDFENLIRDLFEKIYGEKGGEVKVTQASRDGGVDAVAFDPDPVTGGKILIQAKRYTNVVGVGAVRDLAGAVHHEGAMKGILVTTSNFGHDAMKFVAKEPISLINGQNLLSLLNKYGYRAHIDIKEARKILKEQEKN